MAICFWISSLIILDFGKISHDYGNGLQTYVVRNLTKVQVDNVFSTYFKSGAVFSILVICASH